MTEQVNGLVGAQTLVQEEVSYPRVFLGWEERSRWQLCFPLHQMSEQDRGGQVGQADQVDQNDLQRQQLNVSYTMMHKRAKR